MILQYITLENILHVNTEYNARMVKEVNFKLGIYILIFKKGQMKTQLSDFTFRFSGHGHYQVTYTSPITGKQWTTVTNNMPLIDATKNADNPKRKDLDYLKELCKK